MAYGMNPQELAKVGQDVNKQGKGVDEQSIQAATQIKSGEGGGQFGHQGCWSC